MEDYSLSNRERKKERVPKAPKVRTWKGDSKGGPIKMISTSKRRPYDLERSNGFFSRRVMRLGSDDTWVSRVINRDGTSKEILHRLDGPARITLEGDETYFFQGQALVRIESDGDIRVPLPECDYNWVIIDEK